MMTEKRHNSKGLLRTTAASLPFGSGGSRDSHHWAKEAKCNETFRQNQPDPLAYPRVDSMNAQMFADLGCSISHDNMVPIAPARGSTTNAGPASPSSSMVVTWSAMGNVSPAEICFDGNKGGRILSTPEEDTSILSRAERTSANNLCNSACGGLDCNLLATSPVLMTLGKGANGCTEHKCP